MIGLAVHINLTNTYLQVIKNADSLSHFAFLIFSFSLKQRSWKWSLPIFRFQQELIKEPQNYGKQTAFTVFVFSL